uniref:ATP synthase subunit a n=1 Tax=Plectus acuminatus TaxID=70689 RepID=A0A1U7AFQ8_PLEAC|nr:ATP synthase F0 subunit 6 [Plectus acuminatus]
MSSLFEGSELSLFWVLNYLAVMTLGYFLYVGSESKLIPYGSVSWTFFITLCVALMSHNLCSLYPYNPCFFSMLWSSLLVSIWAWIFAFMTLTVKGLKHFLMHLVSKGTGLFLGVTLVYAELISFVIRVGTLGVRIVANLTTGHVLLALIANTYYSSFIASTSLSFMFFLLEILVCLVQGYVFTLLVSLYVSGS